MYIFIWFSEDYYTWNVQLGIVMKGKIVSIFFVFVQIQKYKLI